MPSPEGVARPSLRPIPALALQRLLRRLLADIHVLLAIALVVAASVTAIVGDEQAEGSILLAGCAFIAIQCSLGIVRFRGRRNSDDFILPLIRMALAIAFVTLANASIGDPTFRPAAVLYIPIVVLASALGAALALVVGCLEILVYLVRVLYGSPEHASASVQRAVGLAVTIIVLSVGTRRTVAAMTLAMTRSRTARAKDRRRSRQISAVEEVGRLLAATGPTPATLDRVVGLLQIDLGYAFVSLYLGQAGAMRLAAHRGYQSVIETFDGSAGVMGRVMRTGNAAFLPDVTLDPDYLSADSSVQAEISAPLKVGTELIGVVNVEAAANPGLDRTDFDTVLLVADRLASALALARERARLQDRAELFRRLSIFSGTVNGTLDAESLYEQIVHAIPAVVETDIVVLSVLDRTSGRYRIRAAFGAGAKFVGMEVQAGEGLAGRAIRDRAVVVDDTFSRDRYPTSVQAEPGAEVVAGVGIPLVRDDVVVGALTLVRDAARPFESTELEVLPILAGLTALSVTNTFLHGEVSESASRDPLSGLFNRRHLDAVLGHMDAVRARQAPDDRRRVSVILFDLDRFGTFNKRFGHQIGDAVLRRFADVLQERLRTADLVARYGGEEFVVVLDGASLEEAGKVAEEIRDRFASETVEAPDGARVSATVSAGCAAMASDLGTFAQLIARADMALAIAKHAGRNRVVTA